MYSNTDLERMPFIFMSDFYKAFFTVSAIVVIVLFLWGLFSKKHDLVKNIIGIELLLFNLYVYLLISQDCFAELGLSIQAGIDLYYVIQYLRAYLYMVFAISAVSLFKLLLFLLLIVKGFVQNRRIKKKSAETARNENEVIVKEPEAEVGDTTDDPVQDQS